MTDFRAHVRRADFAMASLQLVISSGAITDLNGQFSHCVKELAGSSGTIFERVPEMSEVPKVFLDEDVAKALMLGLLEYFGEYKGDVRVLRQDYQAERQRVDRFIDYLVRNK